MRKPAIKTKRRLGRHGTARCSAEPIPTLLFCGEAVWLGLNDKERTRTTAINVSDVLDAVVRLMRREARQNGQKLSHAAGDSRQPETRIENCQA